ncbi:hypothetical protein [Rhodopirellula europaea]|uniref:Putative membrane protein n=1 Tax=Rhodopirellula europaea 6C TaxID=1263867 RepID=M2AXQ9_9BACT|nr:hypothetical protein [Rhodopirellula europaea]EMB14328.1 putative membrane protein [Rhodopirellula europaea 6C]|tara:strand:+ start:1649 stop:1996 length:348 start_codon:yes stop_codon:yes gene_type:complete
MKVSEGQRGSRTGNERIDSSPDEAERIGAHSMPLTDFAGGCLMSLSSVALSCGLLLINGAFVMACLSALSAAGVPWFQSEEASQFILFGGPVALLIIQWMMLDYLRFLWRRRQAG